MRNSLKILKCFFFFFNSNYLSHTSCLQPSPFSLPPSTGFMGANRRASRLMCRASSKCLTPGSSLKALPHCIPSCSRTGKPATGLPAPQTSKIFTITFNGHCSGVLFELVHFCPTLTTFLLFFSQHVVLPEGEPKARITS